MLRKFIAFAFILVLAVSCKEEEAIDYGPIDQKIIEDYIAANGITNAQSTASGLYYVIYKPGGTNHPNEKSSVSVNYKGYLTDGTIFDSSYPMGKPSELDLTSVVKGWQEGMQLIGVGGKIQLFVPSELGYGSSAAGSIPANSVIIFDVEMVDFY
jgi:FKBP-type peptidyl-prolyl cis-trans isomerase